jgi:hypothetical protein
MLTRQKTGAQIMSIISKLKGAAQTLREAIEQDYFTPWAMDTARARAHGAEAARLSAGMTPEAYYRQQTDPALFVSHDGVEYADPHETDPQYWPAPDPHELTVEVPAGDGTETLTARQIENSRYDAYDLFGPAGESLGQARLQDGQYEVYTAEHFVGNVPTLPDALKAIHADAAEDAAADRELLAVYGTTRTPAEPGAGGTDMNADPWAEDVDVRGQAAPHEIDPQYWPAPDYKPDEWYEPGDAPGDWWAGPTDEYPTLQAWVEAHPDQAAASGVYPSQQAWLDAHPPSSAELDALEADQERRDQAAMEDPESYGDFWAYQPTPADYRETLPQEGPFGTLQDWREQRDEYESLSGDARARYLSDRAAEIAEGGPDMAATVTVRMLRDGVTAEDVQQVFGTADAWATTAQAQPPPTVAEEAMRSAIAHGVGPYAQAHADDPEAGSALDGYEAAQTVEEAAAFAGIGPAELEADLESENGPAHADYPHEPGTLYDCAGCESGPCAHPEGEGDDWCVSGQHRQRQADPIQENEPIHVFNPQGLGGILSTFRWNPLAGAPEVIQGAVEPSAEWHREPDGYADEMTEIREREAGANDGFMAAPVAQKEAGS